MCSHVPWYVFLQKKRDFCKHFYCFIMENLSEKIWVIMNGNVTCIVWRKHTRLDKFFIGSTGVSENCFQCKNLWLNMLLSAWGLASLLCKFKRQYPLTCRVSRYCLLALCGSITRYYLRSSQRSELVEINPSHNTLWNTSQVIAGKM